MSRTYWRLASPVLLIAVVGLLAADDLPNLEGPKKPLADVEAGKGKAGKGKAGKGKAGSRKAGAGKVVPQIPDPEKAAEDLTVFRQPTPTPATEVQAGQVRCGNLIYANNKTSRCFSNSFLSEITKQSNILTDPTLVPVKVESTDLYQFPFAVMTGEGAFTLTAEQRLAFRNYLTSGGFVVASAGCSSDAWAASFRNEIGQIFPETPLTTIDFSHAVFHTVYDIARLDCAKKFKSAQLEGLEIDGRIVLIFSADGLNDTSKAGGNCCCCGGNEVRNSRQINVNLLSYALTH